MVQFSKSNLKTRGSGWRAGARPRCLADTATCRPPGCVRVCIGGGTPNPSQIHPKSAPKRSAEHGARPAPHVSGAGEKPLRAKESGHVPLSSLLHPKRHQQGNHHTHTTLQVPTSPPTPHTPGSNKYPRVTDRIPSLIPARVLNPIPPPTSAWAFGEFLHLFLAAHEPGL